MILKGKKRACEVNFNKSQSAIEAAVLIGFMSMALIVFLVFSYSRAVETQEKRDTEALSDIMEVIEAEVNLAAAASDGYYRVFELPPLVNGKDYDVAFIGRGVTNANFTEVELKYLNKSIFLNTVTPKNIVGKICRGKNLAVKTADIVNISCVECSNSDDDDLNGCIDYPADLGCSSADDPSESGGICMTECSDLLDNDLDGCSDFPTDSGCTSASDSIEAGGICQCPDGTPFGQCGQNGEYCSGGNLIDACSPPQNCACSPGFGCQGSVCISNDLSCQASQSCSASDLFHISNLSNGHAEINTLTDYPYRICCSSSETLSTSCASPDARLISLSSTTDAHAERYNQTNYSIQICLSSLQNTVSCSFVNSSGSGLSICTSAGFNTCVATLSGYTNAHSADCITNPYDLKVCCKIIP